MSQIATVTLNPALDVTYRVRALQVGGSIRVLETRSQAGGKGINVARVLQALGQASQAIAPLGGLLRAPFEEQCAAWGLPLRSVPINGSTRQTITVVDEAGQATMLSEPGPKLSEAEQDEVVRAAALALETAPALIVSGSLPGGTAPALVGELVALCQRRRRVSLVDTSGEALLIAARAGAEIVKPNEEELLRSTGQTDVDTAAASLLDLGAHMVIVSRAAEGLIAYTETSRLAASGVPIQHGNPTGAGDAVVAALALAAATNMGRQEGLRLACAAGAAAVRQPYAGWVEASDVKELISHVRIA